MDHLLNVGVITTKVRIRNSLKFFSLGTASSVAIRLFP